MMSLELFIDLFIGFSLLNLVAAYIAWCFVRDARFSRDVLLIEFAMLRLAHDISEDDDSSIKKIDLLLSFVAKNPRFFDVDKIIAIALLVRKAERETIKTESNIETDKITAPRSNDPRIQKIIEDATHKMAQRLAYRLLHEKLSGVLALMSCKILRVMHLKRSAAYIREKFLEASVNQSVDFAFGNLHDRCVFH